MKRSSEFSDFAANVLANVNRELDKALACLWFAEYSGSAPEMTAKEIAACMVESGLTGSVNITRLARNLRGSTFTVRGTAKGSFRVSPVRRSKLDDHYQVFLKRPRPKVSDELLPSEVTEGARKYLRDLAHQANGTYDSGFYDACAVLCRRIVESLVIDCFDRTGSLSSIQNRDGSLQMLEAILREAKSGRHFRLPRKTADLIDKIKEVGDTAAHDRYHITTQQDIGEFRVGFRKVVSQLLGIAESAK